MNFFYIGDDNENDIRRRHEARDHPITITGLTVDGQIKDFTGVVQTVDLDPERPDGKQVARDHSGIKPPTLEPKAGSGSPAR